MAKAIGIDMATNPFWQQLVAIELEVAVNSSFQKNGYTIVDPNTAGNQFCAHVRREREQWIGGANESYYLAFGDAGPFESSLNIRTVSTLLASIIGQLLSHGIGPLDRFGATKRNASIGRKRRR